MERAARIFIGVLCLLALARAVSLELDPYDAYEVRLSARAIAGYASAPFAIYRSALLSLLEAPFEALGRGSWLTARAPHVLGALAYLGLAVATFALARAAGASPLASHAAAVAVALDRIAFADAPLGLPDGLAACLATAGLAVGLRVLEAPQPRTCALAGLLLGLGAATRPNAGLACVALFAVAGFVGLGKGESSARERTTLGWTACACVVAFLVYLVLQNLFFVLGRRSIALGLHANAELGEFHRLQFDENARKYGSEFPPLLVYLRAALAMEPWTAILAPASLGFALARGNRKTWALALAFLAQGVFLTKLVGHGEARYLLPAMPPLAALAALVLDRAASAFAGSKRSVALVAASVAWIGLPLALGARFEAARATDPVFRTNFSRNVADGIAQVSTGRVVWVPYLTYAVYPEVLSREGTPFPGDPFHGICHAGPLTVTYHLGRPVLKLAARDERGETAPAPSTPEDVLELARASGLEDGCVVLLVPREQLLSWKPGSLPEPPPPLRRFVVRRDRERVRLEALEDVRFR